MYKIYDNTKVLFIPAPTPTQLGNGKILKGTVVVPRPYCGDKEIIPKGKYRARANLCYKIGLRTGFRAGIEQFNKYKTPIPTIVSQGLAPTATPSIKDLYKNVSKSTRLRDFMAVLPIQNPIYNFGGSQYKSIRDKKALGTDGLKKWLIDTVKEYSL